MSNNSNSDIGCELFILFIIVGFLALLYFILTHPFFSFITIVYLSLFYNYFSAKKGSFKRYEYLNKIIVFTIFLLRLLLVFSLSLLIFK